MSKHIQTGQTGEEQAAAWLTERGYEILHRNWRHSHYEIDIVARKNGRLHFVEVKTRHAGYAGYPEDSVSRKKFKHLKRAVDAFLHLNPGNGWIQYDILAITIRKENPPEYFLLEDVFL